jgi:hypothetical protein
VRTPSRGYSARRRGRYSTKNCVPLRRSAKQSTERKSEPPRHLATMCSDRSCSKATRLTRCSVICATIRLFAVELIDLAHQMRREILTLSKALRRRSAQRLIPRFALPGIPGLLRLPVAGTYSPYSVQPTMAVCLRHSTCRVRLSPPFRIGGRSLTRSRAAFCPSDGRGSQW